MMSEPLHTEWPHLTPVEPSRERLWSCDICYESETEDIMAGTSHTLRPMYHDARDGCVICQRCAETGRYLDLDDDPGKAAT